MIEGHGDDAWQYKITIKADFSSNIWHGGLNPGLEQHLKKGISSITHYPEAGAQTLRSAAAAAYGVAPDQVLVANGATEAIYLVAQAFRHKKIATILTPSFAEYADACRLHGLDIRQQSWATVTAESRFAENLVFCCNPNNPTGTAMPLAQLQQLVHDNPRALFAIDESYIEFTRATQSFLPSLAGHHNVLLLRSLTKSCCIPGLRIGFAIAHPDLIRQLYNYKMPWSVNRLAIEAALYIFRHPQQFVLPLDQLLATTASFRHALQEATGWLVHATDTHYFHIDTHNADPASGPTATLPSDRWRPSPSDRERPSALGARPTSARPISAADLKAYLVYNHGLLIRDAANFEGLTPLHFRVACQSADHNQLLTDALRQCSRTGI